mmetsp:Transcript_93548/g.264871  ORF Transcript_93548/g.264871 Transcript_93548/m.264871 type:complete len:217 (+) Transcript_93548:200-850(+)
MHTGVRHPGPPVRGGRGGVPGRALHDARRAVDRRRRAHDPRGALRADGQRLLRDLGRPDRLLADGHRGPLLPEGAPRDGCKRARQLHGGAPARQPHGVRADGLELQHRRRLVQRERRLGARVQRHQPHHLRDALRLPGGGQGAAALQVHRVLLAALVGWRCRDHLREPVRDVLRERLLQLLGGRGSFRLHCPECMGPLVFEYGADKRKRGVRRIPA